MFVTIDPTRDTVGQLRHYSRDFDSRFQWLTGTPEQIAAVTKSFRVYIGKVGLPSDDMTNASHLLMICE